MNDASMKTTYLHLNSRDELLRIDVSKIVYFEADGNYTSIILANQLKCIVCMNLSRMQKVLEDKLKEQSGVFVRVGKKFIINHTYIFKISLLQQKLLMSDGQNFIFYLSVSKEALKNLKLLYSTVRNV